MDHDLGGSTCQRLRQNLTVNSVFLVQVMKRRHDFTM